MLVRVSLNELTQAQRLQFDLYERNGSLLMEAGTHLTSKELNNLSFLSVYRSWHNLPFNHEELELKGPNVPLTDAEIIESIQEDRTPAVYEDRDSLGLITSIDDFWNRMAVGDTPDLALCEVVRDKLVSEVTSKVDQIHYLSQLRVRDGYTYSHTLNVAALSIALAKQVGMNQEEIKEIGLAAMIHDLGKLFIPKPIMFKTTRLTEKEFDVMKLHPGIGYQIIKDTLKLPEHIARPALEHQEMYNGGGYPQNICGDAIHPYSQIVKVADVYEALTARRPYKDSIPSSRAIQIMLSEGEKSFNPKLLTAFVEMSHYQEVNPQK